MINFENVTFKYNETEFPILENVNLTIPSGELVLVVGKTGSGKSTFLGLINGLVPNFSGGDFSGDVIVFDRSIKSFQPRDFADLVGVVKQDPRSSFVTDNVEDELAYSMEQLGIPSSTMRRRVEEVLDLLGLNELRGRSLATLSGGQRQRVAIASVLTTNPKVLVLDEPTSALDPSAAE
ncbi:MAG: ABC transporter ATP-binding protein, partial [Candidatus Nanopelagicales bacterium]